MFENLLINSNTTHTKITT